MRPAVTLAILARDAAATIARTIDSALPYIDEVVVRDTGSKDSTVEVAQRRGARVVRGAWHDDFAAARNLLLTACRTPWVFVLDADEEIAEGGAVVRTMTRCGTAPCYTADITSLHGRQHSPAVRLLRNRPDFRYRYRVYECLRGEDLALPAPIRIVHHGVQGVAGTEKAIRNLALLQLDLEAHPTDPYLWWRRAEVLRDLGRDDGDAWQRLATTLAALGVPELRLLPWIPEALTSWLGTDNEWTQSPSTQFPSTQSPSTQSPSAQSPSAQSPSAQSTQAQSTQGPGPLARLVPLTTRVALAHPDRPAARLLHVRALFAAGRVDHAALALRGLLEPAKWLYRSAGEAFIVATAAPRLQALLRQTTAVAS